MGPGARYLRESGENGPGERVKWFPKRTRKHKKTAAFSCGGDIYIGVPTSIRFPSKS